VSSSKIKLGIVGVGKIVRDQHVPSINKTSVFEIVATASRNASLDGVDAYKDIETMLESTDMDAVALCMPPQYRYSAAQVALSKGKHVLLEKPPGATVSEVDQLVALAQQNDVSLYATWHSRHGAAVEQAKSILGGRELKSVSLTWKENVRKWHPGQDWIWQAGGLGVFDPGINGLSILTHCLSSPAFVTKATLSFPANKASPIAANVDFQTACGVPVSGEFDWRVSGSESWSIAFDTTEGLVHILDGGARLVLDGVEQDVPLHSEHGEYEAIYSRFADVINNAELDVDLSPLKLVADAFLLGARHTVDSFEE
jgi:D-galactose 1-dehydrogenase